MNPRLSAVVVGALTALVSTLGLLPAHAGGAPAAGAPAPGSPGIARIALTDAAGHRTAAALAGGPERAAAAIRTGAVTVDEFLVAGLTWAAGEQFPVGADIKLRVREDGDWSKWLDVGPEAGSDDPAARGGTEPFITGGADGVQVVVTGSPADLPADLRLSLVSEADDGAPATASTVTSSTADDGAPVTSSTMLTQSLSVTTTDAVTAVATEPAVVVTRGGWGLAADEEDYTTLHWTPKFYPLQAAVVHHTAGTNSYTAEQSAGVVHAIWVFHAKENGWGDIGYNFLVDKYGQLFEGRRHSLPDSGAYSVAPEVPAGWSIAAAHATGYNNGGLGISALGDYTKPDKFADPDDPDLLSAIAQLIAWKFNEANLDVVVDGARVPSGFISPGTSSTYPVGADLPRIFVHKDVASTLCPGSIAGSAVMDQLHARVVDLYDEEIYLPQATDTTPPEVTLAATNGTVSLTALDDSDVTPAIFLTVDYTSVLTKVYYSPDWDDQQDPNSDLYLCGDGLESTGVTNARSCVVNTRYTEPLALLESATVSYVAVDGSANTSPQVATYVPVGGTVVPNTAPAVTITSPADGGTYASGAPVAFVGIASDTEDGDLSGSLEWASDVDGPIETGGSFSTILADGTHTITATVSDSGGLPASDSITIIVGTANTDPPAEIVLTVRPYKIKAAKFAELTWAGGTPNFTVYRNGAGLATDVSASLFTDTLPKTTVSATYKVCDAADPAICSSEVTVTW